MTTPFAALEKRGFFSRFPRLVMTDIFSARARAVLIEHEKKVTVDIDIPVDCDRYDYDTHLSGC